MSTVGPAPDSERELAAAAHVQRALLPPSTLRWHRWTAAHRYEPLEPVGGDLIDLVPHDDRLYFVLADVSGKGMAASMLTTYIHAVLRTLIPFGLAVEEIVRRLSALLCASTLSAQYATLVFGYAEPDGQIVMANAGHPPPFVGAPGGEIGLVPTGAAAGMFCDSEYHTTRIQLSPGDTLVLYTDGLTETFGPGGCEYGVERAIRLANESVHASPEELVRKLVEDRDRFAEPTAHRTDDVAVLAIRFD